VLRPLMNWRMYASLQTFSKTEQNNKLDLKIGKENLYIYKNKIEYNERKPEMKNTYGM